MSSDLEDTWSFRQSYGERFVRALQRSLPSIGTTIGMATAALALSADGRQVSIVLVVAAVSPAIVLVYALWTAWTRRWIEGRVLGYRDLLRSMAAAAVSGFATWALETSLRSLWHP